MQKYIYHVFIITFLDLMFWIMIFTSISMRQFFRSFVKLNILNLNIVCFIKHGKTHLSITIYNIFINENFNVY